MSKRIWYVLILIMLVLTSCAPNAPYDITTEEIIVDMFPNVGYSISRRVSEREGGYMFYPQLFLPSNRDFEEEFSQHIYENILIYGGRGDYKIMLQTENFLSIRFLRWRDTGAHVRRFIQTVNVDMEQEQILRLSDIVDVDEVIAFSENLNIGFRQANGVTIFRPSEYNHLDTLHWRPWHLTPTSLVLSAGQPQAFGGFAVFEIPFIEIVDYLTDDFRSRMRL